MAYIYRTVSFFKRIFQFPEIGRQRSFVIRNEQSAVVNYCTCNKYLVAHWIR